jgi:hypothetical protein
MVTFATGVHRARTCRERPDEVQRHQVGLVILKETIAVFGTGKNTPTDSHQMIASYFLSPDHILALTHSAMILRAATTKHGYFWNNVTTRLLESRCPALKSDSEDFKRVETVCRVAI